MKKTGLICGILLCSALAFAKAAPTSGKGGKAPKGSDAEQEIFSQVDMKIFHDRQMMQTLFLQLYGQQTQNKTQRDNVTQGIFNEKDSATLEKMMDNKQIKYKITPAMVKKAGQAPFEAFQEMIKTADVSQMTEEEMKDLESVDRRAIPEIMEMMDASGPSIGAGRVSVIYDNETQN